MSAAPILADITVDGRAIKAVAVPSKQAWLYVFDRVTGQPVWPIEERPVPQSDVPGEKTLADAAVPARQAALCAQRLQRARRPDRLHSRAPSRGCRENQAVPLGRDAVQSADARRRQGPAGCDHGRHRHELARWRFRSRDAHPLCAGWEYADLEIARGATAGILGSSVRHGSRRTADRRSLGAG